MYPFGVSPAGPPGPPASWSMANRQLPPLILHPFSDASGPGKLVDASRASLILHGLLPGQDFSTQQLEERLLEGRYCELTMLFYLGKDLLRWVSQSMEIVEQTEELKDSGIRPESFSALLVEDPPADVVHKLRTWGVHEHRTIFSRALGLHAVFEALPGRDGLAPDFMRYYHRFADHMFTCRQQLFSFTPVSSAEFEFQLYASGEYSKMLEREWGAM